MSWYRASRQNDDTNGAFDAEMNSRTMRDVDFHVTEMRDPHRTAVYLNARNLALGLKVFRSPRLPQDEMACLKIIAEARDILMGKLEKAGVL